MRRKGQLRARQKGAVPGKKATPQLPLCRCMNPREGVPIDAAGVVLIRRLAELRPGRFAISILAHGLPAPEEQGPYDQYQGLVFVPEVIAWTFPLYTTPETPPTWAGTFAESTLDPTPNGIAQVRAVHSMTGAIGPVVLEGTLRNSQRRATRSR